jgi:uncharacterized protein YjbJ (UPF0337 family)
LVFVSTPEAAAQPLRPCFFLTQTEAAMNSTTMKGKWNELKGKVKEKWGKLTNDDLDVIDGKKDQLVGRLQQRYGYAKERAEKEAEEFCHSCDERQSCA